MPSNSEIIPATIEYDFAKLNENIGSLYRMLPEKSKLLYSLKANNHDHLLNEIKNLLDGFDIASQEELEMIIEEGINNKIIFLTGNDKRSINFELLENASKNNRLIYSIESSNDYLYFCSLLEKDMGIEAVFRLSYFPGATYGILNGLPDSPFGMIADDINGVLKHADIRAKGKIIGLHFYIGSQLANIYSFTETLKNAFKEINKINADFISSIKVLNMGGGFPAAYGKCVESGVDYSQEKILLDGISGIIKDNNVKNAEIIFESGRAIVGSTGRLKCTILDFNTRCASPYIVINTGIAQIAGLYLLRRIKEPDLEFYHPTSIKSQAIKFKVYGPSCTQLDMLGYATLDESQLVIGNILFCDNMGAYCSNASLNGFHAKKRIKEIVIDNQK